MNINKAISFSKKAHENQKRKYTGEPYFNHCEEVALLVASVGGTLEMICAAYLHDTVEDTSVSLEEISHQFGAEIATLVDFLTDVSKPSDGNRLIRKKIDREHISKASPDAKTVKLADLISNSWSIVKHDPDFSKIYLREKKLLLEVLKDGNKELFEKANQILKENGY